MPHNVAFHHDLHGFLYKKDLERKKYNFIWKVEPETPCYVHCTMDCPKSVVSNQKEESMTHKGVKLIID